MTAENSAELKRIKEIVADIKNQGGKLSVVEDNLRIFIPKGKLTDELKQLLSLHKAALIRYLSQAVHENETFDLNTEVRLDFSVNSGLPHVIGHENLSPKTLFKQAKVLFITGATGFLGAFLLEQYLKKTQMSIYCLVRADNAEAGINRIEENLSKYGIEYKSLRQRITVIPGDVTLAKFGLKQKQYDHIAEKADVIFHCAAVLNYILPYRHLKQANVIGTHETLQFACHKKTKQYHFISSLAVFNSPFYANKTVDENDRAEHCKDILLGYSQTKWVAEQLVQTAGKLGLPTVIYRLPFVFADSHTGFGPTDDIIFRIIKAGIQMRCMSNYQYPLLIVPVDYAVQSIFVLASKCTTTNSTFHLLAQNSISLNELALWMREYGYSMKLVDYPEWLQALHKERLNRENALHPLLPFFLTKWQHHQLTLIETYQHWQADISAHKTKEILLNNGIECPAIDGNLLNTYFQHCLAKGFFTAP